MPIDLDELQTRIATCDHLLRVATDTQGKSERIEAFNSVTEAEHRLASYLRHHAPAILCELRAGREATKETA